LLDLRGMSALAELRQQDELDAIVGKLATLGYRPALRSARESLAEVAGLSTDDLTALDVLSERRFRVGREEEGAVTGEILFGEESALLLVPARTRLFVAEVRNGFEPSILSQFTTDVESAARDSLDGRRLRGMDFTWRDEALPGLRVQDGPDPLSDLTQQEPEYDSQQLEKSRELIDHEGRTFFMGVVQSGKASLADLGDRGAVLPLLDAGLLRQEYLLVCRKDSRALLTVPDLGDLGDAANLPCAACGRPMKDELAQEIVSPTPEGKSLADGSKWMTIWITDELVAAGVPLESISWSVSAGEDEIDIVARVAGLPVFFELKDREFGLGDAYRFVTRVVRYGGEHGVVITTDRVNEEAKKYLDEQGDSPVGTMRMYTVEGAAATTSSLSTILSSASRLAVTRRVQGLARFTPLNPLPLLQPWMAARG
jgi:hypothetical protein